MDQQDRGNPASIRPGTREAVELIHVNESTHILCHSVDKLFNNAHIGI